MDLLGIKVFTFMGGAYALNRFFYLRMCNPLKGALLREVR